MKGGSLHAPPVDIGLLYLGMHALDAAALLGLLSASICSISICSILAAAVRSRICHGSLSHKCAMVRFWPLSTLLLYDLSHRPRSSKSHSVGSIFACAEPPSEMMIYNLR